MCRMIIACGEFSVADVIKAARAMAAGEIIKHDGSIKQHPDGWGCLWISNGQVRVLHGDDNFVEASSRVKILDENIEFLAVHVRHATLSKNMGVQFSHPLHRENGGISWYMMHNGFMPTVYHHLGLSVSSFDSAEYLEYIVGTIESLAGINKEYLVNKLAQLSPGGSSGNFFLMTQYKAWVWQWFPEQTSCAEYFTMKHYAGDKVEYISSEIIPLLGGASEWRAMQNAELYELELRGVRCERTC